MSIYIYIYIGENLLDLSKQLGRLLDETDINQFNENKHSQLNMNQTNESSKNFLGNNSKLNIDYIKYGEDNIENDQNNILHNIKDEIDNNINNNIDKSTKEIDLKQINLKHKSNQNQNHYYSNSDDLELSNHDIINTDSNSLS